MTLNTATMPSNPARHFDTYAADWHRFMASRQENGSDSDTVNALRREGWQEFERIGFPVHRRGNELWKYTDLRRIDRDAFNFGIPSTSVSRSEVAARVPLPDSWHNIVFLDGNLSDDLSDAMDATQDVAIGLASESEQIGSLAECVDDAFVALNTAFIADGISITVPDDASIDKPIHIVFATTESDDGQRAVYPRVAINIGDNASATVIESHVSMSENPHLSVPVVEISIGEDASLSHYRVQLDNENAFHFSTTRIQQGSGSEYRSTSFSIGSAIGRNDVHTALVGESAETQLHGVYLTTNRQHQDNEISTTHAAPGCTSDQYFKGILSGRSRAVFSGKIVVERGAQKTDANQKDLNLLLSHGAEVDTKPSLEIYADDVKCAHGATAGHVDEDTLFYLQSRGVDYDAAQAMLIRGFAAEILAEFDEEDLRSFLESKLDELMPQLQAASDTIGTA